MNKRHLAARGDAASSTTGVVCGYPRWRYRTGCLDLVTCLNCIGVVECAREDVEARREVGR